MLWRIRSQRVIIIIIIIIIANAIFGKIGRIASEEVTLELLKTNAFLYWSVDFNAFHYQKVI